MLPLTGKNVVVIGGSRGVGRRIVETAIRNGARVLAVARQEGPLQQLVNDVPGTEILSLDATHDGAPDKVFDTLRPILVVGAGAFPPAAPLHKQTWPERAKRSALSLDGRGSRMAAFAWCRRQPIGSLLSHCILAPGLRDLGPRTPSRCFRSSRMQFRS